MGQRPLQQARGTLGRVGAAGSYGPPAGVGLACTSLPASLSWSAPHCGSYRQTTEFPPVFEVQVQPPGVCGVCPHPTLTLPASPPTPRVWAWSPGGQEGGRTSRPCFPARAGPGQDHSREGGGGPGAEQAGCWQALSPGQEPCWTSFTQMRASARPVRVWGAGKLDQRAGCGGTRAGS